MSTSRRDIRGAAMGAIIAILSSVTWGLSVNWLARRSGFQRWPVTSFYYFFFVGSVVLNLVGAAFYPYQSEMLPGFTLYASYVVLASLILFSVLVRKEGVDLRSRLPPFTSRDAQRTRIVVVIGFVPFATVALIFLVTGFQSGGALGTPEWRAAISSSASGYEYLIFNSGAVLLALHVAISRGRLGSHLVALAGIALLLVYGGRFLAVLAVLIGFFVRIARGAVVSSKKVLVAAGAVGVVVVMLGAYRYAASAQISMSVDLLAATLQRQAAGPVYDFTLSYGYADPVLVRQLILQKIKVALLPFLFDHHGAYGLGEYLAMMAGRGFEAGHRISAIGEVYYLLGATGVVTLAVGMAGATRIADILVRRTGDYFIVGVTLVFGLGFLFFIDFAYVVTLFYLIAYLGILASFSRLVRRIGVRSS